MLLIDSKQVFIGTCYRYVLDTKEQLDPYVARILMLNSIRSVRNWKLDPNTIIACDNGSWRYDIFPHYKSKRSNEKKKDGYLDWDMVDSCYKTITDELSEVMPIHCIKLPKTEADDIIAVLTKYASDSGENVVIVSKDDDFAQLHQYDNVERYNPHDRNLIPAPDVDPLDYLVEKIIRGDSGDSIPNVLSPVDSFITGTRQKPITKNRIEEAAEELFSDSPSKKLLDRFMLNRRLIDFSMIPNDVQKAIIQAYERKPAGTQLAFQKYLQTHNATLALSNIHDFF